jgi:hypothetical protein
MAACHAGRRDAGGAPSVRRPPLSRTAWRPSESELGWQERFEVQLGERDVDRCRERHEGGQQLQFAINLMRVRDGQIIEALGYTKTP